MRDNILKGGIIFLMLLLLVVVSVSAVNAQSNDTSIQTLSKGGLVINYPSDWGYSDATSQYAIMAISKKDSVDSASVGQVNIIAEKKPIEGGDFYTFVNKTYDDMKYDPNFELVSSGNTILSGNDAVEYVYTSNVDNVKKEHKAVWFEKGGQAYVLMYSAPIDQFESNLYVFDYIISDIQIT